MHKNWINRVNAINAAHNCITWLARDIPTSIPSSKFIMVKDNLAVKGQPLTCASLMLSSLISPFTANCLEALEREMGYFIVGRTNMDEFGMGSHTRESPLYGPIRNYYFDNEKMGKCEERKECSVGGSSGGAAMAILYDLVSLAIGSDTGGSIRLPAAYTNIIGFKPSYGRITRHGLVSYANSLDTIGILGKDINQIQEAFQIMSNDGKGDMTIKKRNLDKNPIKESTKESKIIKDMIESSEFEGFLGAYHVIASIEALSNLSRYNVKLFMDNTNSKVPVSFGSAVNKKLTLAKEIIQKKRELIIMAEEWRTKAKDTFNKIFNLGEFYIMPTTTISSKLFPLSHDNTTNQNLDINLDLLEALMKGKFQGNLDNSIAVDMMTIPASLAGIPSINLPIKTEMGYGLQVCSPFMKDEELLNFSKWSLLT